MRTPSAHDGISGRWKPRPFRCCAVSPLACQEQTIAVVTSNHGATARPLPSVPPNASSAPPTKSFAQATNASDDHPKMAAAQPEFGQPPFTWKHRWFPARLLCAQWSVVCSESLHMPFRLDFSLDYGIIYMKFAGLRDQLFPNRGLEYR